ncbi:ABC transporter ATP-binding protein [Patescibacteria group bacterium]
MPENLLQQPVIQIDNVTKTFPGKGWFKRRAKDVLAIDQVSFDVAHNEIFGIIGPNGSGKTTLIKMITSFIYQDAGTIWVNGRDTLEDFEALKDQLGFIISEERSFFFRLSGRQNLEYYGMLQKIPRKELHKKIDELLERLELAPAADKRYQEYSTGMRRKLGVARGLLVERPIYLLDEPTTAIDPVSTVTIENLIRELRDAGHTILFSSHDMHQVERLADRVGILNKGRLIGLGEPSELIKRILSQYDYFIMAMLDRPITKDLIQQIGQLENIKHIDSPDAEHKSLRVVTNKPSSVVAPLIHILGKQEDLNVINFGVRQPSLEEAFIKISGV